jgi:hypothetical protein
VSYPEASGKSDAAPPGSLDHPDAGASIARHCSMFAIVT